MAITGKTSTQGPSPNSQRRIEAAIDELKVDRKARDAGLTNKPEANSTVLDANQQEIVGHFTTQLRQAKSDCESRLRKLELDRSATARKIDIEQTKHSFARILNAVEPGLERLKQEYRHGLQQAKENEERALRYLRWFQQEHGLYQRAATYPPSYVSHFAIVAVIAVIEWISLANFYAEGSDFGLLGGIVIAMVLSAANISLAIFIGIWLRYLNHKNLVRKRLALVGIVFLASCLVLVTLGAAHYRIATNEIAQSQVALEQNRAVGTGSTALIPSGADQLRAAKLAAEHFLRNPLGLEDIFSWVLVVLAITFAILAVYKGYFIDDPYPGYGKHDRDFREKTNAYEAKKQEYTHAVDRFFDKTLQEQSGLLSEVKTSVEYYQELASRTSDEIRTFQRESGEIQDACNIVIARYRQSNTQVATERRPAYFQESISLDDNLRTLPGGLLPGEEELRKRYDNAIKEFSEIAQTNDGSVQSLRTAEIRRLEDYFQNLERDVKDKLQREAAEINS